MKRRGFAYDGLVGLGVIFLAGILSAALYYGTFLPSQSTTVGLYGSGVYQGSVLDFVDIFMSSVPLMLTVGLVVWWLNRSNKRDLTY